MNGGDERAGHGSRCRQAINGLLEAPQLPRTRRLAASGGGGGLFGPDNNWSDSDQSLGPPALRTAAINHRLAHSDLHRHARAEALQLHSPRYSRQREQPSIKL